MLRKAKPPLTSLKQDTGKCEMVTEVQGAALLLPGWRMQLSLSAFCSSRAGIWSFKEEQETSLFSPHLCRVRSWERRLQLLGLVCIPSGARLS